MIGGKEMIAEVTVKCPVTNKDCQPLLYHKKPKRTQRCIDCRRGDGTVYRPGSVRKWGVFA